MFIFVGVATLGNFSFLEKYISILYDSVIRNDKSGCMPGLIYELIHTMVTKDIDTKPYFSMKSFFVLSSMLRFNGITIFVFIEY